MSNMAINEATIDDIGSMLVIRKSVRENVLADPGSVTEEDCVEYLTTRGKGWTCVIDGEMAGFAIIDVKDDNVWALFVHPQHEGKGVGRRLQVEMLDWYFAQGKEMVWLGTDPDTRAAGFYQKSEWRKVGMRDNGEIRFEMTEKEWSNKRQGYF